MATQNNLDLAYSPLKSSYASVDVYMVVGQDVVTFWLGQGWELYGSPTLDSYGWARQPIIKRKHTKVTTTASPDSETTLEVEKNVTDGDERSSDD